MDLSRMSQGERIAAAGGVLLFIFLFLPWFGDLSGWEGQSSTDIYMLITAGVAVAAALMPGNDTGIPGVTRTGAAALLGIVALVLVLWLLIFDFPEGDDRGGDLRAQLALDHGGGARRGRLERPDERGAQHDHRGERRERRRDGTALDGARDDVRQQPGEGEDDERQAPFEPAFVAPHAIEHGHYRSNPSEKSMYGR